MALTEAQIEDRIAELAKNMRARGLAFSDMQARERARDVVMQEMRMQQDFEKMKDDPALNPQQRPRVVSDETLKGSGGMLTGDELPKNRHLADILKGRRKEE